MTILTDENYVDIAEKAILKLERNTRNRKNPDAFFLTTSKLRNLLSLTSTLFDESKVKEYDASILVEAMLLQPLVQSIRLLLKILLPTYRSFLVQVSKEK